MKGFLSLYRFRLPSYFVYMLQQVEYNPTKFHKWFLRNLKSNKSIRTIKQRQDLVVTNRARMLLFLSYVFIILSAFFILYISRNNTLSLKFTIFAVYFIVLPYLLEIYLVIVAFFAHKFVVVPQKNKLINKSTKVFANHKGIKIAVIGSYGKTTVKELLNTVISQGKKVAATPGNMNVQVSHAKYARSLIGDEDVLIVEFGEGEPGDVESMSATLKPDFAVITGLAPNHLDLYPSVDSIASDFLSVYKYTQKENVFLSGESELLLKYIDEGADTYDSKEVMGWKISDIKITIDGTSFKMKKDNNSMSISSSLLGEHQVANIALAAALADKIGLSKSEIELGCSKTKPFEHRMQPRFIHGAWIIDDTYNGNLIGIKAGLKLLNNLDAKRKWYVTPGLVDQGEETDSVHVEIGKEIAKYNPDIVVLMDNSVRQLIEKSMKEYGFTGELRVEPNPLEFYKNLEHIVVAGDLLVMQNDWTDNYN